MKYIYTANNLSINMDTNINNFDWLEKLQKEPVVGTLFCVGNSCLWENIYTILLIVFMLTYVWAA